MSTRASKPWHHAPYYSTTINALHADICRPSASASARPSQTHSHHGEVAPPLVPTIRDVTVYETPLCFTPPPACSLPTPPSPETARPDPHGTHTPPLERLPSHVTSTASVLGAPWLMQTPWRTSACAAAEKRAKGGGDAATCVCTVRRSASTCPPHTPAAHKGIPALSRTAQLRATYLLRDGHRGAALALSPSHRYSRRQRRRLGLHNQPVGQPCTAPSTPIPQAERCQTRAVTCSAQPRLPWHPGSAWPCWHARTAPNTETPATPPASPSVNDLVNRQQHQVQVFEDGLLLHLLPAHPSRQRSGARHGRGWIVMACMCMPRTHAQPQP